MNSIEVRRLASTDSLEALTNLLHRAFEPLGRLGLNCTGVDQSVDTTRQRVALGDCFVALVDGQIVGTVTVHAPDAASPVLHYREASVASIHQFAVEPSHQGCGVGSVLLRTAEQWARRARCHQLALHTPESASHLRAYYRRQGFKVVEMVRFDGKSYRSAVLSKPLLACTKRQRVNYWLWRRPAEMAVWANRRRASAVRARSSSTPRLPGLPALGRL